MTIATATSSTLALLLLLPPRAVALPVSPARRLAHPGLSDTPTARDAAGKWSYSPATLNSSACETPPDLPGIFPFGPKWGFGSVDCAALDSPASKRMGGAARVCTFKIQMVTCYKKPMNKKLG